MRISIVLHVWLPPRRFTIRAGSTRPTQTRTCTPRCTGGRWSSPPPRQLHRHGTERVPQRAAGAAGGIFQSTLTPTLPPPLHQRSLLPLPQTHTHSHLIYIHIHAPHICSAMLPPSMDGYVSSVGVMHFVPTDFCQTFNSGCTGPSCGQGSTRHGNKPARTP